MPGETRGAAELTPGSWPWGARPTRTVPLALGWEPWAVCWAGGREVCRPARSGDLKGCIKVPGFILGTGEAEGLPSRPQRGGIALLPPPFSERAADPARLSVWTTQPPATPAGLVFSFGRPELIPGCWGSGRVLASPDAGWTWASVSPGDKVAACGCRGTDRAGSRSLRLASRCTRCRVWEGPACCGQSAWRAGCPLL